MAKKLNWEKEAKRLKVIRYGSQPLYEDLPVFTGSPAQHKIIKKQQANKKRAELAKQIPMRRVGRSANVKVLRRRKNEGIIELEKSK